MSSIVVNNIAQYIDALVRFIDTLIMMMKLNIHLTIVCLIGAALILIVVKISSNAHGHNNDETKMFQPADQVNLRGFISELINEYNTKCAQRGQKQLFQDELYY
ncbi:unnamed protein product [Rotaria sp. Silwood2]|nr:unnamed protein product [Rotaria sp. Silwood2]